MMYSSQIIRPFEERERVLRSAGLALSALIADCCEAIAGVPKLSEGLSPRPSGAGTQTQVPTWSVPLGLPHRVAAETTGCGPAATPLEFVPGGDRWFSPGPAGLTSPFAATACMRAGHLQDSGLHFFRPDGAHGRAAGREATSSMDG